MNSEVKNVGKTRDECEAQIEAVLRERMSTITEISEKTGFSRGMTTGLLMHMRYYGNVARRSDGRWHLAGKGRR